MKGLITNEWDRDNLNFLLNVKGDDFAAWYAQSDADDKAYAQELMDAYSRELKLRAEELEIEARLGFNNTPDAKRVIDQFRLTK
jgi:predicted signal transduction protein with EAL and GGDEF domain